MKKFPKVYIFGYNPGSRSARSLAKALNIPFIRHEGSKFLARRDKLVINWGASRFPDFIRGTQVINSPDDVHACSNKLAFFEKMSEGGTGPRVVDWTTDAEQALEWVEDGVVVVARKVLNGSGGDGIVFLDKRNVGNHLDAPLFTAYKPKKEEYRVHVFEGMVLDVQQKLLRKTDDSGQPIDPKKVDFRVRNLANGFVFGRNDVHPNRDVIDQSVRAIQKSGLTFGAVDVIWNDKEGKAYVLEINSAPGLEGTTIQNYTNAFKSLLEQRLEKAGRAGA
jgi:hypothetical protein